MERASPAPGIMIDHDEGHLVIRIEHERAGPLLSILLHSKFSDGPRLEFLTSPYTNTLIAALMTASHLTEYMAHRDGIEEALAPVIQMIEDWTKRNNFPAEEAASLMREAVYPYRLA